MAKPYSMDLRERAVATVLKEGLSRHESAARFGVAPSTVINWCGGFKRLAAQRQPRWAAQTQGDCRRARDVSGAAGPGGPLHFARTGRRTRRARP